MTNVQTFHIKSFKGNVSLSQPALLDEKKFLSGPFGVGCCSTGRVPIFAFPTKSCTWRISPFCQQKGLSFSSISWTQSLKNVQRKGRKKKTPPARTCSFNHEFYHIWRLKFFWKTSTFEWTNFWSLSSCFSYGKTKMSLQKGLPAILEL